MGLAQPAPETAMVQSSELPKKQSGQSELQKYSSQSRSMQPLGQSCPLATAASTAARFVAAGELPHHLLQLTKQLCDLRVSTYLSIATRVDNLYKIYEPAIVLRQKRSPKSSNGYGQTSSS